MAVGEIISVSRENPCDRLCRHPTGLSATGLRGIAGRQRLGFFLCPRNANDNGFHCFFLSLLIRLDMPNYARFAGLAEGSLPQCCPSVNVPLTVHLHSRQR
jgi:hypothetical protein